MKTREELEREVLSLTDRLNVAAESVRGLLSVIRGATTPEFRKTKVYERCISLGEAIADQTELAAPKLAMLLRQETAKEFLRDCEEVARKSENGDWKAGAASVAEIIKRRVGL